MKKWLLILLAVITCDSALVLPTWEAGPTIYTIRKDGKVIYQERGMAGQYPAIYELAKSLVEVQSKVSVLEAK